jgi:hypothetical protein
MVKEIEKLRAAALDKSMDELPVQSARSVLVRKNTDKISFAFLLSKPGPHSGIPSTHFFGILSEVEPYGVFDDLIPQQPLRHSELLKPLFLT